jgi:hypothetical protein
LGEHFYCHLREEEALGWSFERPWTEREAEYVLQWGIESIHEVRDHL